MFLLVRGAFTFSSDRVDLEHNLFHVRDPTVMEWMGLGKAYWRLLQLGYERWRLGRVSCLYVFAEQSTLEWTWLYSVVSACSIVTSNSQWEHQNDRSMGVLTSLS